MEELILAVVLGLFALIQTGAWIVVGATRKTIAAVPTYMMILAVGTIATMGIGLLSIPVLIIIKVFTGWAPAVYIAACLAAIFTFVLGVLWSPIGVLVGTILNFDPKLPIGSLHPVKAGERYLRIVAATFFAELMISLGIIVIPFHHNTGMIAVFVLVGAAVIIANLLWREKFSGKFWRRIATVAFVIIILSFFLPQTFDVVGKKAREIDEKIATVLQKKAPATLAPVDYPICAGHPMYDLRQLKLDKGEVQLDGDEMELNLSPKCWSGWIMIPTSSIAQVETFDPGDLEYKFWDGKRELVPDKTVKFNVRSDLPNQTFRLRGSGRVRINLLSSKKSKRPDYF